MNIMSRNSIDVIVNNFLTGVKTGTYYNLDNFIGFEFVKEPVNGSNNHMRITGVKLGLYSDDLHTSSFETILRFRQPVFGVPKQNYLVYYKNDYDDSVIDEEDAKKIIADKVKYLFDEYVFED